MAASRARRFGFAGQSGGRSSLNANGLFSERQLPKAVIGQRTSGQAMQRYEALLLQKSQGQRSYRPAKPETVQDVLEACPRETCARQVIYAITECSVTVRRVSHRYLVSERQGGYEESVRWSEKFKPTSPALMPPILAKAFRGEP